MECRSFLSQFSNFVLESILWVNFKELVLIKYWRNSKQNHDQKMKNYILRGEKNHLKIENNSNNKVLCITEKM